MVCLDRHGTIGLCEKGEKGEIVSLSSQRDVDNAAV